MILFIEKFYTIIPSFLLDNKNYSIFNFEFDLRKSLQGKG
ncbi:hypothetical protein FDUTEX481_01498 [Tolypothrix sp. PCC 7601]|nr:hypothetical protein FDUTEX481_01498 [Tolypothrix sp. PCC 7601]